MEPWPSALTSQPPVFVRRGSDRTLTGLSTYQVCSLKPSSGTFRKLVTASLSQFATRSKDPLDNRLPRRPSKHRRDVTLTGQPDGGVCLGNAATKCPSPVARGVQKDEENLGLRLKRQNLSQKRRCTQKGGRKNKKKQKKKQFHPTFQKTPRKKKNKNKKTKSITKKKF